MNSLDDFFKPYWLSPYILFSKYLGMKTAIIYRGKYIHINLYWFLSYHPEDSYFTSQLIDNDPNKISIIWFKPEGFNIYIVEELEKLLKLGTLKNISDMDFRGDNTEVKN